MESPKSWLGNNCGADNDGARVFCVSEKDRVNVRETDSSDTRHKAPDHPDQAYPTRIERGTKEGFARIINSMIERRPDITLADFMSGEDSELSEAVVMILHSLPDDMSEGFAKCRESLQQRVDAHVRSVIGVDFKQAYSVDTHYPVCLERKRNLSQIPSATVKMPIPDSQEMGGQYMVLCDAMDLLRDGKIDESQILAVTMPVGEYQLRFDSHLLQSMLPG